MVVFLSVREGGEAILRIKELNGYRGLNIRERSPGRYPMLGFWLELLTFYC